MKKFAFLLGILAIISLAYSQPFVSGSDFISLYAGENKTIEYIIINKDSKPQTFVVFVSGFYREGILIDVYPKILTLEPNQQGKISIYIEVKKFAKEVKPTLFYLNVKYENQTFEKSLILQVLRKFPVYVSSLELSRYSLYPLETLTLTMNIENVKDEITPNYKAVFTILFDNKEIFRREKITDYIPSYGSLKVSEHFVADKYQKAGKYEVLAQLYTLRGELVDEIRSAFEVKPVEKIPDSFTRKEIKYSLLEAYVRIEIKNEGNVVSRPFYLVETLPSFMKDFFYPYAKPDEIESSFGYVSYKWLIRPLQPGESVIVEYKISLWQAWIALIIIILIVIFLFRKTYTPAISKKASKEDGKIKVMIKVKNNSKSIMKEVVVEDIIPPMFKVTSYFGAKGEESEIKKTKERKVVWKINELKPEEEAIFGYYLEPIVEIISARLSEPKLKYTDEKGKKVELSGNEISL